MGCYYIVGYFFGAEKGLASGRFAPLLLAAPVAGFAFGFALCALNFFALANLSPKALAAGWVLALVEFLWAAGLCAPVLLLKLLRVLGVGLRALVTGSMAGINAEAAEPIK